MLGCINYKVVYVNCILLCSVIDTVNNVQSCYHEWGSHGGQCVKAESATNLMGGTQDSQVPVTERFWA